MIVTWQVKSVHCSVATLESCPCTLMRMDSLQQARQDLLSECLAHRTSMITWAASVRVSRRSLVRVWGEQETLSTMLLTMLLTSLRTLTPPQPTRNLAIFRSCSTCTIALHQKSS